MTIDHFKDAPEWADTVLFSEERQCNVFAFTKIHAARINGMESVMKMLSWPGFDNPRHGYGEFIVVAQRDRDFSKTPKGLDVDLYKSVEISKATSLLQPLLMPINPNSVTLTGQNK